MLAGSKECASVRQSSQQTRRDQDNCRWQSECKAGEGECSRNVAIVWCGEVSKLIPLVVAS